MYISEVKIDQRYTDIMDMLRRAQIMYHIFKEPIINDMFYDALVKEQLEIERRFPKIVKTTAVARSIASQVLSFGNPAKHDYPMLRLNRKYDLTGLISWLKILPVGSTVNIQTKVTGVSLELIYIDGKLNKAITFGDGMVGRDITINAYCISGIPETIKDRGRISIRGVVTTKTLLVTTEGEVRAMDAMELKCHVGTYIGRSKGTSELSDLRFIAHTASNPDQTLNTWSDWDAKLRQHGFVTPKTYVARTRADIYEPGHWEEILDGIKERIQNSSYLPLFNGLVLSVNEMQHRYDLGYTSRFPEWALAYTPDKGFTNGTCETPLISQQPD